MSDIKSEVQKKQREATAKAKQRDAMKHESRQAAGQDSRLEHYVEQEKAELKNRSKLAEANKDLRTG